MKKWIMVLGFLVTAAAAGPAFGQAVPPARLNYQGVLRSNTGAPVDASVPMTFRMFNAVVAGDEILVDAHTLASGSLDVIVDNGLFNVVLGTGTVSDGAGPGVYTSLAAVFRDYGDLYLEVQVGLEVLNPRIRIVSSGYALNADHLDGRSSSFFLDTSAAAQEKTGLLIATGGVDYGPGASDDLTSADVATLTGGGNADALHTHALVGSANTLDGIDSSQFLRSDTSDSFTSGTLTTAAGTTLNVDGALALNGSFQMDDNGPEGTQLVYFYDAGSATGQSMRWNEARDDFEFSNDLGVLGRLYVGGLFDSNTVTYNRFGPGSTNPTSGQMNNNQDVFIEGDVEVDGIVNLNGQLKVDDDGAAGADTSQFIYFFDDALAVNETLRWDDPDDRFEFSNELAIAGPVRVGSTSALPVAYSAFGTGAAEVAASSADVYVSNNLEVDNALYLNGLLYRG